ncbi:MAG: flavodoxin domain-containing protein [Acidimicrobiia bacterium]|nr:flavodoxin domain-containing protein [Acidimicrobiia bacterium]
MRVLVMPTSKYGGTAEIGRAIAKTLREEGIDVDVSQPENLFDVSIYDGFILGSAIYIGKWLKRASRFVELHSEELKAKPTWLFSSGPLGPANPEQPIRPDVVEQLVQLTGAREHRILAGRLELDRLSPKERFIAQWVGAEEGDHRDWDEIEQWSRDIAAQLKPPSTM